MISITPLEAWIRNRTRIGHNLSGVHFMNALEAYQLQRVNVTLAYARSNAPFYKHHLASLPTTPLSSLSDIAGIPFTTASNISENPNIFSAVRQDDIARIVTLRTSGSTGEAKRLFFTDADLELTVDFFHHGMSTLVRPGQSVAILLPGESPDSGGDLLLRGLRRMDVRTQVFGPVADPGHAAEAITSFGAHCLVGIPTQVLAVAKSRAGSRIEKGCIESVLLSTDYVPRALARSLEEVWGCRVFTHYGMTEMGLGGGVECDALDGYHLREADLYFEVVDHETGEVCPDGVTGEVVFTTLTRDGMPLIRYRTGDIARFITQPCPCGSDLRRMEYVRGRWDGIVRLSSECSLALSDMDEALFLLPDLLDYRVTVSTGEDGKFRLRFSVHIAEGSNLSDREVIARLSEVGAIRKALADQIIETPKVHFSEEGRWVTTGVSKRRIVWANSG
jgi:phenylacetate-CoA ligase